MEIHLIRHIEPALAKGICYGQSDIQLPADYQKVHKSIIDRLPKGFDNVYTSPLQRCTLLANQIVANPIEDPRLMELNFGDWELKNWDDIDKNALDIWMGNYIDNAPPNGESLNNLVARFSAFTKTLNGKKNIIVTHAGIVRCAFHLFNKQSLDQVMMEKVIYGERYVFNL